MKTLIRPALSLFVLLSVITGIIYPLATTVIGKTIFADKAGGSLIEANHQLAGSRLIGQNFSHPNYFWGRPSATSPIPYNGMSSGGSNLGQTNPAQKAAVVDRIKALRDADPDNTTAIPVDLVTASASGLDPHISLAAANYQMQRVAKVRNLDISALKQLVAYHTETPQFGLFGEARVNVLQLNLALDELNKS